MELAIGTAICFGLALGLLALAIRSRRGPVDASESTEGESRGALRLKALGAMLRPGEGDALSELRGRTVRAGLHSRDAMDLFLTARLILLLGGGVLTLVVVANAEDVLATVTLASVITAVSVVGPSWWLDKRAAARQAQVASALPETLDLLIACLDAGLSLQGALERVAAIAEEKDVLGSELNLVLDDLELGVPMERAFRRFGERIGSDEATSLATVVIKAVTLGGQITEILRGHAERLRENQLMMLEELAGKANAKLALPLTICLLPSGMILYFAPAFLALFKNL